MQVELIFDSKWLLPSDLLPFRYPSGMQVKLIVLSKAPSRLVTFRYPSGILPVSFRHAGVLTHFPNKSLERLVHGWQLADLGWLVGGGGQVGEREVGQGRVGGQAATASAAWNAHREAQTVKFRASSE